MPRRKACDQCVGAKSRCSFTSPYAEKCVRCTKSRVLCSGGDRPSQREYDTSSIEWPSSGSTERRQWNPSSFPEHLIFPEACDLSTPQHSESPVGTLPTMRLDKTLSNANGASVPSSDIPINSFTGQTPVSNGVDSENQLSYPLFHPDDMNPILLHLLAEPLRSFSESRPGTTLVQQAVDRGLYTRADADNLYMKLSNSLPLLPLDLPDTLAELDAVRPDLAISIITAMATIVSLDETRQAQRQMFVDLFFKQLLGDYPVSAPSALAVLCAYALPPGQKGLSRLLAFADISLVVSRDLRRAGKEEERSLCQRLTALLVLPYAFIEEFSPLRDLIDSRLMLSDSLGEVKPLLDAVRLWVKAIANTAHSSLDAAFEEFESGKKALVSYETLLWKWSALEPAFALARLKLMRTLVMRVLMEPELDQTVAEKVTMVLREANMVGDRATRLVAKFVAPGFTYESVIDVLLVMQALRFAAFALGTSLDVCAMDTFKRVSYRWEHMAHRSHLAQQNQTILSKPREILEFEIGVKDPQTGRIAGPGSIASFDVFHKGVLLNEYNRDMLRELMRDVIDTESSQHETVLTQPLGHMLSRIVKDEDLYH